MEARTVLDRSDQCRRIKRARWSQLRLSLSRELADAMNSRIHELLSSQNPLFNGLIEFLLVAELFSSHYKLSKVLARNLLLRPEVSQYRIDIDYVTRLQTEIGAMTTELVMLRPVHHLRAHRIEMDVAHQLAEVLIRLAKD